MIEFIPDINGQLIRYTSHENGVFTGNIECELSRYSCKIISLIADKQETAEGLIRAALSAAANRNAYTAEFCTDSFFETAYKLGFKREKTRIIGEIPELLKGSCGNCSK